MPRKVRRKEYYNKVPKILTKSFILQVASEMSQTGLIFLALGGAIFVMAVSHSLHKIEEGHVGVYYRGGALLNDIAYPGYHMMIPYVTTYRSVQTTLQTDEVFSNVSLVQNVLMLNRLIVLSR